MDIVIDANKIFSALIKPSSRILLSIYDERYHFYAPNFAIVELLKHQQKVRSMSPLDDTEYSIHLKAIIERVQFVLPETISLEHHLAAFELCKDVDPSDYLFVALSLHLDCKIWSGDRKLKAALLAKGYDFFVEI